MSEAERVLLVGCGILHHEVQLVLQKKQWAVDTLFLDSALHSDFAALAQALTAALARHTGRRLLVLYGCCHPAMDQFVARVEAVRIAGQNCVEMLLGPEEFTAELAQGAFFLLEDWACRWDAILARGMGTNLKVIRNIFQGDRQYLLALRTPCSGDFREAAEAAGRRVGLPVRWRDVSLEHLERALEQALTELGSRG